MTMAAAEILLVGALLAAIWGVRRRQLQCLKEQAIHLRRFAEQIQAWRERPNVPQLARDAVEELFRFPFERKIVRDVAFWILSRKFGQPPSLDDNPFWRARQTLAIDQREHFDRLVTTYLTAWTYSDWFWGGFLRRARFGGLSNETRAEVALETVYSRQMSRAARA
jgi:hypothetical protein